MSNEWTIADLGPIPAPAPPYVAPDDAEVQQRAAIVEDLALLLPAPEFFTHSLLRSWTPGLTVADRRRVSAALPDELQISVWHEHRTDLAELVLPEDEAQAATAVPLRRRASRGTDDLDAILDALRAIPAAQYVPALARVDVPERGGAICCPLPGHEDRTPSFHVYPGDGGWYCHGACATGGGVIDLAAHLWGRPTRGPEFPQLVREVRDTLLSTGRGGG